VKKDCEGQCTKTIYEDMIWWHYNYLSTTAPSNLWIWIPIILMTCVRYRFYASWALRLIMDNSSQLWKLVRSPYRFWTILSVSDSMTILWELSNGSARYFPPFGEGRIDKTANDKWSSKHPVRNTWGVEWAIGASVSLVLKSWRIKH